MFTKLKSYRIGKELYRRRVLAICSVFELDFSNQINFKAIHTEPHFGTEFHLFANDQIDKNSGEAAS